MEDGTAVMVNAHGKSDRVLGVVIASIGQVLDPKVEHLFLGQLVLGILPLLPEPGDE